MMNTVINIVQNYDPYRDIMYFHLYIASIQGMFCPDNFSDNKTQICFWSASRIRLSEDSWQTPQMILPSQMVNLAVP